MFVYDEINGPMTKNYYFRHFSLCNVVDCYVHRHFPFVCPRNADLEEANRDNTNALKKKKREAKS